MSNFKDLKMLKKQLKILMVISYLTNFPNSEAEIEGQRMRVKYSQVTGSRRVFKRRLGRRTNDRTRHRDIN